MTQQKNKLDCLENIECKFENYIIEMHSDIKSLVSEVKSIDGYVKENSINIKETNKLVNKHSVYWGLLFVAVPIVLAVFGWIIEKLLCKS